MRVGPRIASFDPSELSRCNARTNRDPQVTFPMGAALDEMREQRRVLRSLDVNIN